MRPRIITLTSDFGLADSYVAAMKAAVLAIDPSIQLVDVSHLVAPQNIAQGAYLLQTVVPIFPSDAIHLAVVDPGVGTSRKPLAVEGRHGLFVGPDNGLFTPALAAQACIDPADGRLLSHTTAVELREDRFRRAQVSRTFHGRDIFAPAAAHLARGVPLLELGPRLERLEVLQESVPRWVDGALHGSFIHIDHFGNAISNIPAHELPPSPVFHCGDVVLHGLSSSYRDAAIVALVGSTGMVEIALRDGDAASALGLGVGDEIVVRSET